MAVEEGIESEGISMWKLDCDSGHTPTNIGRAASGRASTANTSGSALGHRALSVPVAAWLMLALGLALLLGGCQIGPGSSTTKSYTYTGFWEGGKQTLAKANDISQQQLSSATIQGQLNNFQTSDPVFTCLDGKSLDVYTVDNVVFRGKYLVYSVCPSAQSSASSPTPGPSGYWTFSQPPPPPYSYSATWENQNVTLTKALGKELPPDASLLGRIGNFQTTDPMYTCFVGATANVWTSPLELPGKYLAYGGCPGHDPGLWFFAPSYGYSGLWQGQPVTLKPVIASPSVPADAQLLGELSGFTTDDPNYFCQVNGALNIYAAPKEFPEPETLVLYGGCPGGIPGVWTFHVIPHPHYYSATWNGKQVALSLIDLKNAPADAVQAASSKQVTDFRTDDPTYTCFVGGSFNVWTAPELSNLYLVYGFCGSGQRGAWTFPQA
jgi:hypothetical protein